MEPDGGGKMLKTAGSIKYEFTPVVPLAQMQKRPQKGRRKGRINSAHRLGRGPPPIHANGEPHTSCQVTFGATINPQHVRASLNFLLLLRCFHLALFRYVLVFYSGYFNLSTVQIRTDCDRFRCEGLMIL